MKGQENPAGGCSTPMQNPGVKPREEGPLRSITVQMEPEVQISNVEDETKRTRPTLPMQLPMDCYVMELQVT